MLIKKLNNNYLLIIILNSFSVMSCDTCTTCTVSCGIYCYNINGKPKPMTPALKVCQTPGIGGGNLALKTPGIGSVLPMTPALKVCQTPGIGFTPPNPMLHGAKPSPKRPAFSDDTTKPPWWTTMTPEEANAAIATAAKATLAAMQAAQANKDIATAAKPIASATNERKPCSFSWFHANAFAKLINDEAAAQGDNGWTGWVAEPRRPARQMVSPAYLAPLSLSSYEQFRASRGRPMVFSEQSQRHVMLLPGAKPVGNVTVVSPSGEVVNMDAKEFGEWERAAAAATATTVTATASTAQVEEADCGLVRTMGVL